MKYTCSKCGGPATHAKEYNEKATPKTPACISLGTWSCKPCGGKTKVKREKTDAR